VSYSYLSLWEINYYKRKNLKAQFSFLEHRKDASMILEGVIMAEEEVSELKKQIRKLWFALVLLFLMVIVLVMQSMNVYFIYLQSFGHSNLYIASELMFVTFVAVIFFAVTITAVKLG